MFEWDSAKNAANIAKHKLSFEEAIQAFDGPVFTIVDDRMDYGELREIPIGLIKSRAIVAIVHTDRQGRTRLISARRANKKERALYHGHYPQEAQ
ncbi:MAG: uncharacterized DUF497 family protein [Maricaulis maris]|jgi:uncharacterized DUF497 family protein